MEQIQVNIELFGVVNIKEYNKLTKLYIAPNSCLLDLIERINIYPNSKVLELIKKSITEKKDLSCCVILFNGKRITDYNTLCSTKLEEGNTVTLMLPMVAG